ncbi:MAG: substrate-binding domain-containing protein [Lachnospiraceae bacterium]|nr:substrate-binding domain-containing protein [Lachnospiraceae bacterium]
MDSSHGCDIPLVLVDYVYNERISVVSDNVEGMTALTEYICRCGHKKIAYLHGEPSAVTRKRLTSFYNCMEKYRVTVPDEYVREAQYRNSYIAGVITNELLDLPEPPTCIIYTDDFSAIGGMNVIKDRGLKIPEDISIAGYDGILIASQIEPVLTTYKQDTKEIGTLAASKLIELIEKPKSTIVASYAVMGQLIEGKSVAEPKKEVCFRNEV